MPNATKARRWLLGAEASNKSESKDSSSGMGSDTGGLGDWGGWCFSELPGGPPKGRA